MDFDFISIKKLIEIENANGIYSTVFFQPNCPLYNMLSESVMSTIEFIHQCGGIIGLHLDQGFFKNSQELQEGIVFMYDFYSRYIPLSKVFSYHRPSVYDYEDFNIDGFYNAYDASIFNNFVYISDSSRRAFWRQDRLSTAINEGKSVNLVTHPVWWRKKDSDLDQCKNSFKTLFNETILDEYLTPQYGFREKYN